MDVQMPDGTLIQGVPDGITKSQLLSKYAKYQGTPENAPSPKNGLISRIQDDYTKRIGNMQQSADAYVSGKQGNLETAFQFGGQALNYGLNDIPGEVVKSVVDNTPDVVKDAASNLYNTIENIPGIGTPIRAGNYVLDQARQGYNKFKQNYPRAGRDLDAALGYGSAVAAALPIKGESLPSQAVGAGQSLVKKTTDLIPAKKSLSREEQTAQLRNSASNLYKQSAAEDLQLGEQDIGKLATSLNSLTPKTDLEKRSWASSNAAKQVQDITESLDTEIPSFNGLLAKRSELNSKIKVATRTGDDAEAYKLNRVKDALDEAMIGADSGKWQLANHQWAQQAVLDDMDEIVNKALTKAQPANSLDTALNNYLGSYKSKGLSDEEWKALKEVTNNSSFDKLRKGAASGLTKYAAAAIGSTGGPIGQATGYLMGHYGSEFLKDSAIASKVQKLDKFREMIANRKPPQPKSDSISEIMLKNRKEKQ